MYDTNFGGYRFNKEEELLAGPRLEKTKWAYWKKNFLNEWRGTLAW